MKNVWIIVLALFIVLPFPAVALEFNLYGDMTIQASDDSTAFSIGTLDLNAQEHISDSTIVTTQLLLDDEEGHGVEVEIERFTISKHLSDSFAITAGKFHKPLGLWKQNFNHGSLVQDAVDKPFFLEFKESHEGIFPAHLVGINFEGESANWSYQVAIANSTGMNTELTAPGNHLTHTLNTSDPSNDKTLVFRGTYRLTERLELGVLALSNKVVEIGHLAEGAEGAESATGTTLFDQSVLGLDFSYRRDNYYAFGETYQSSYDDNPLLSGANPDTYNAQAYYVQLGMDLSNNLTLYTRYENLSFDDNATFFSVQGIAEGSRTLIGLSYRLEESHTLRFEARQTDFAGSDADMHYTLQWYFLLL